MNSSVAVACPICGGDVDVQADVILNELLDCGDCGAELEVTGIEPAVQLAAAPESAEDWGQ